MATATHPYAELLGDRNPLDVLAETEKSLPALAQKLGPDGLKRTYAPGKWTAAEILSHLADCEIAFGFRVRQILAEPVLPIQPFDESGWARHYGDMDGVAAAQTFESLRGWNLSLFKKLSEEEMSREARHPERGPQSADTAIRVMAGHTLHHIAQLEKIVAE
jgi:DinB superfamily